MGLLFVILGLLTLGVSGAAYTYPLVRNLEAEVPDATLEDEQAPWPAIPVPGGWFLPEPGREWIRASRGGLVKQFEPDERGEQTYDETVEHAASRQDEEASEDRSQDVEGEGNNDAERSEDSENEE